MQPAADLPVGVVSGSCESFVEGVFTWAAAGVITARAPSSPQPAVRVKQSIRHWRETALLAPIVFLAGAFLLAGVLGFQALQADDAHRDAKARALRDYAAVAAWEFSRRAEDEIRPAASSILSLAAGPRDSAPDLAILVDPAALAACDCPVRPVVRTAFAVDYPSAAGLEVAGAPLPDSSRAFLVEALRQSFHTPGRASEPTLLFLSESGTAAIVAYRLLEGADGRPARAYGFVADGAPMLEETFPRVMRGRPLLPPALTGPHPNDSLLVVQVSTLPGATIYSSSPGERILPAAVDRLGEPGHVLTAVSFRPGARTRLANSSSGGWTSTLMSLVALSAGMVLMAFYHLRRAMHLTAMRSQFVTSVSHELRTPLAQIRMFAETLGYGRARSDEERNRFIAILHREAVRLSELVENVLQFARLDQRKEHLTFATVDLRQESHDAAVSLAPIVATQGATIVNEVPPGARVWADRGAVRRIILNLLDNALKYGPAGQTISIGAAVEAGSVRLRVDDQGPGVPAGARDTIFRAFERHGVGPSSPTGSGIGLTIVRELASALGGTVHVEDRPGGGARFVVTLLDAPP
jgi:signal transduction histidine kinase